MKSLAALARRLSLVLALTLASGPGWGQGGGQPPVSPFLRIELGTHSAPITRVVPLPDGQRVLTVSLDKTARLWAADGSMLRSFRPPIGDGDEGALAAAAVSPDGATAWVAGQTGAAWGRTAVVYAFNIEDGAMRRLNTGVPASVTALAPSADGQRLAVGFARSGGIAIIDFQRREVYHRPDLGIANGVRSLAFDRSGRLAVASGDGSVRLLAPDFRPIAQHRLTEGGQPGDIAFSPDGKLLAVGMANMPQVRLLDAASLRAQRNPPIGNGLGQQRQDLRSVAWVPGPGGAALVAAGYVLNPQGQSVALRWSNLAAQPAALLALGGTDAILQLNALPDGRMLFAAADPAWGVLALDAKSGLRVAPSRADFRGVAQGLSQPGVDRTEFGFTRQGPGSFRVSPDGMAVEFGLHQGGQDVLRFDVAERRLTRLQGPSNLPGPVPGVLPLREWLNGQSPRFADKLLQLDEGERARSAALLPGNSGFLLGTDFAIRWFDMNGNLQASMVAPAAVWGVQPTADGRQVVAALGDGTLRWYDLNPTNALAPRAALFVHGDARRWLLWTPEGFFDHSDEGGQNLAGFHLNRAANESAEWIAFNQLHRVFYAEDLVRRRLAFADEAPMRERLAQIGDVRRLLAGANPPRVTLSALCYALPTGSEECRPVSPTGATRGLGRVRDSGGEAAATNLGGTTPIPAATNGLELPEGVTEVVLRAALFERGGGVGQVDVFVNGRNQGRAETRGLRREAPAAPAPTPLPAGAQPLERRIRLEPGTNTLQLRAFDAGNSAFGQSELVELRAPVRSRTAEAPRQPVLHVLSIGVDDYTATAAEGLRSLSNAAEDAQTLVRGIQGRPARAYGRVNSVVLNDRDASLPSIEAAFERLRAEVKEEDTVVIFIAGHGMADGQRYLFVPYLPQAATMDAIRRDSLDDRRLVALWASLPARNSILLLDTCHAGAFNLDFAGTLQNETGRFVLAAASAQQSAADTAAGRRNSPFSVAIQEALTGATRDIATRGVTDQLQLGLHVRNRTPVLAREVGVDQRVAFRMSAGEIPEPFPLTEARQ
ncbi:hypothetical protein EOD42_23090 [Rhodovarius crocodyli]|uniref:Uncharacterized protein n=1 Tax=Rhodovarius crocodyli TaxID=1979269 RepID=A0A437LZ44_9PROT|nr:caspase family protein [Rhodovarius crocodyli]RVT90691.1 hypothetical protein EOD42_23090 [Rhodovarius crocodyli]